MSNQCVVLFVAALTDVSLHYHNHHHHFCLFCLLLIFRTNLAYTQAGVLCAVCNESGNSCGNAKAKYNFLNETKHETDFTTTDRYNLFYL